MENNILIYSDKPELVETTEKVAISLGMGVYYGEQIEDLYALPACFMLVDPQKLLPDFFDFFREMNELSSPKELALMLTEDAKVPRDLQKFFVTVKNDGKLEQQIRTTILNRRSNIISRRTDKKSFAKKLNRLFAILRKLQQVGDTIKIPDLAVEFGVSEKTIKRDLIFLREEAGEDIRYDRQKKAYYYDNGYFGIINPRGDAI